jgi:hypothetical protein
LKLAGEIEREDIGIVRYVSGGYVPLDCSDVVAALRHLAGASNALTVDEPQEAWQPIETAKRKDGTRIQAWDGKKQFICHFRGEHHEPHQDKPGWFEQHIRMHPTHWKPLGPSPLSRPKLCGGDHD